MRSSLTRAALLVVAVVTVSLACVSPANAASARSAKADQCLAKVTSKSASGELILGPMTCYTSYSDVLRAAGAKSVPNTTSRAQLSAVAASTFILGTHYDGANLTGPSFSVQGSDCGGGGLNVPLSWNDRISSTMNGCATIIHYADTNFAGATATTTGAGGNLTGYMDNATSSIRYFS